MKKVHLVYFSDNTANAVICETISEIPTIIGEKKFRDVVKIDVVPFTILS